MKLLQIIILLFALGYSSYGDVQTVWGTTFGPPLREGNKMADGGVMRRNTVAVALPHKKALGKKIWIRRLDYFKRPVSSWIEVPVRDVGPWFIDDAYWERNRKPRSESWFKKGRKRKDGKRVSNKAGIDLTWTVWQMLGVSKDTARHHSGYVQWSFSSPSRSGVTYAANRTGDIVESGTDKAGALAGNLIRPVGGDVLGDAVSNTTEFAGKVAGKVIRGLGGLFGKKRKPKEKR
jgi:hypothetical protein